MLANVGKKHLIEESTSEEKTRRILLVLLACWIKKIFMYFATSL